jgi:hypothetical protein
LPEAVLSPSGIPINTDKISPEAQKKANEWYAEEYNVLHDISTIFSHYKDLGIS